jgi:putative FmdB family regulatory protein
MPIYDYRCDECGYEFQDVHGFDADQPDCPECESEDVKRVINSAPTIAGGMTTPAGDGKKATKEQLQSKWQEETPKLRKKLRDKLGDDAVDSLHTLNHDYDT